MMRKKLLIVALILIDILTATLIFIQLQSFVSAINYTMSETYSYSFMEYIILSHMFGIIDLIGKSGYQNIYLAMTVILFFLNIISLIIKIRDSKKEEKIFDNFYKYLIIINILYITIQIIVFLCFLYLFF